LPAESNRASDWVRPFDSPYGWDGRGGGQRAIIGLVTIPEAHPDNDIVALQAALATERVARQEAEARASSAEAMVTHLKLLIAKMKRDRFGQSSERGRRLLDQLELQLEELEANATEDAAAAGKVEPDPTTVRGFTRKKPVRGPLPAHLPRERVVIPAPSSCPCCGGKLVKMGEDITETLEVVPRQWKVIQTVREKFTCRTCEKITQPPAPFHVIARARAGASLLAMILYGKFGEHQPLNRQSASFAKEGIDLDVSTLADWVGACAASLTPLIELLRHHVFSAARLHGDETTVPVLAKNKTVTGRLWTYVRDDRPFAGPDPPAAVFYYSRNRAGEHPRRHLAGYAGILQADAYAGFGDLYDARRRPGPITEAACWAHSRRKFFVLADAGKSPLAAEAVRRIDPIFAIEREINGLSAEQRVAVRKTRLRRSSPNWKPGCATSAPDCRITPITPRQWITCSSDGRPSPAFSMTAASASATTPPNAPCAASRCGVHCAPLVQVSGNIGSWFAGTMRHGRPVRPIAAATRSCCRSSARIW